MIYNVRIVNIDLSNTRTRNKETFPLFQTGGIFLFILKRFRSREKASLLFLVVHTIELPSFLKWLPPFV